MKAVAVDELATFAGITATADLLDLASPAGLEPATP